jgi:UDP-N-acetylbacillosamine N-acetyltransferase
MTETTYIIGCGGHARSVADILIHVSKEVAIVFIDKNAREGETIFNFPIWKEKDFLSTDRAFVALGNNEERNTFIIQNPQLNYISIISKTAHIGIESNVREGAFIGHNAHIGPQSAIGSHCIINNGAIVEHEVSVGNYCHIGPNATISGRSSIGDLVFLGVGSTVIDGISICSNVIIGAGSTIVRNITEPGTYVGSPAKKIKHG